MRGAQEEEEEDEGVLGSVLLLSPLLVDGISVDIYNGILVSNIHLHTEKPLDQGLYY